MSDAYVGEIRWFPYVRGVPQGWLPCDGSAVAISDNEALYSLIGTIYGGNGQTDFALPDLRGQVPIHQGQGNGLTDRPLGTAVGTEQVTLTVQNLPGHAHIPQASTTAASQNSPAGMVTAAVAADDTLYVAGPSVSNALLAQTVGISGQGQPHDNCAPTLPIVAGICSAGIFPTRG